MIDSLEQNERGTGRQMCGYIDDTEKYRQIIYGWTDRQTVFSYFVGYFQWYLNTF